MLKEFLRAISMLIYGIIMMIGGLFYFITWSLCIYIVGFYLTNGFSHTLVWWFYS